MKGIFIASTRLSDGTLRSLCLLSVLCNQNSSPLVCIEDMEFGLHPDIIPNIAELLKDTSKRCHLIVTTHSDILIDALSDTPEAVIVASHDNDGTHLERLNGDKHRPCLKNIVWANCGFVATWGEREGKTPCGRRRRQCGLKNTMPPRI